MSVVPKTLWTPDRSTPTCTNCHRPFNSLRRRHHCRYCGLIYCSKCAKRNRRVNGQRLKRICASCVGGIAGSVVESVTSQAWRPTEDGEGSLLDCSDELPAWLSEQAAEEVSELLTELATWKDTQWTTTLNGYFEELMGDLIARNGLPEALMSVCLPLVQQAVYTVCPSVQSRTDSMNVTQYISITKLPLGDRTCSRFTSGVVLTQNVSHRKVKPDHSQPRILFLRSDPSLDTHEIVSMENLIAHRGELSGRVAKLVQQTEATVLVCGTSLSYNLVQSLTSKGIVVIARVKQRMFEMLARAAGAQVVESLDQVPPSCSGRCGRLSREFVETSAFLSFEQLQDSSLAGSIILAGWSSAELSLAAKVTRKLLVAYRNLLLEKQLLYQFELLFVPNIFKTLAAETFTAKSLTVFAGMPCSTIKHVQVHFYTCGDQALGAFIHTYAEKGTQQCQTHSDSQHYLFYLREEGRVKISLELVSVRTAELRVLTECKVCLASQDMAVSRATWEYSFFKFLHNIFAGRGLYHAVCAHDFFSCTKFRFHFGNTVVCIEFEENPVFQIASPRRLVADTPHLTCNPQQKIALVNAAEETLTMLQQLAKDSPNASAVEELLTEFQDIVTELDSVQSGQTLHTRKRRLFLLACEVKLRLVSPSASCVKELVGIVEANDLFFHSPQFSLLKQGSTALPPGTDGLSVPVEEFDTLSIIAYSLNSEQYNVLISQSFPEINTSVLETELLNSSAEPLSVAFSTYDHLDLNGVAHKPETKMIFGSHVNYQVTTYFPRQFHCLRDHMCGRSLLESILCSQSDTQFAKVGSRKVSADNAFFMKIVDETEFQMFLGVAPNYFRYLFKVTCEELPSIITKALGAFKVYVRNQATGRTRTDCVLVWNNIAVPGLSQSYTLTGYTNPRKKDSDETFVRDCGGLPLLLTQDSYRLLHQGLWNDTIFLAKQSLIEYSLLVLISPECNRIALGIVSCSNQFNFEKAIDYKFHHSDIQEEPCKTIPVVYKERFRSYILETFFTACDE